MVGTIVDERGAPARSPVGVATVVAFGALPWLLAVAHSWRFGTVDLVLAFFAYVIVWYSSPMIAAVIWPERPLHRVPIFWAYVAAGAVPWVVLGAYLESQLGTSEATTLALAWLFLSLSALGLTWLAGASAGTVQAIVRGRFIDRLFGATDTWGKAYFVGVASCVVVGPFAAVLNIGGPDPVVLLCGFMVGVNVLAWCLGSCPSPVVLHTVLLLAAPAAVVVLLVQTPSAWLLAALCLAAPAALGATCARSGPQTGTNERA